MTEVNESIERKNAARLVFVQALYGEHFGVTINSAEGWANLYSENRLADEANPEQETDEHSEEVFELKTEYLPDMKFLRKLLRGWLDEKAVVSQLLTTQLSNDEKRSFDRLSPLMQALLNAATYELTHATTKTPVVLKEYVDIAAGFYDNPELGFINGTLQEIANK